VAERLQANGWEVFCPLKMEWRQWSDRKKKVQTPYFRSYVFAKFSMEEEKLALLQTPGVVKILFWLGKPAVIRDEEMQDVQRFFTIYGDEDITTERMEVGASYQISRGVWAGQSGVLVWQNADRAMLEIPSLNMRFSIRKKYLTPQGGVG